MALPFTCTSCAHCKESTLRSCYHFTAGCLGCCARSAARSPQFDRVRRAGALDRPYRALLEQFGLNHATVRAASEADWCTQHRQNAEGAAKFIEHLQQLQGATSPT
jgi:hypothetical protein